MWLIYVFIACLLDTLLAAEFFPVVVVPPTLRYNSTNKLYITPVYEATNGRNVKITVKVTSDAEHGKEVIFRQQISDKKPGHAHTVAFDVPKNVASQARIDIAITGHKDVFFDVLCSPNVRNIHLRTDKGFYKAGETVNLRAVPLTNDGYIYTGDIDFSLVNPDGFELTKHTSSATNSPISMTFDLPEHLYFGEWRINARPAGAPSGAQFMHTVPFQVMDYNVPPFILDLTVTNGDDLEKTSFVASAQYFHGGSVTGSATLSCEQTRKGTSTFEKPKIIAQGQIVNGSWSVTADIKKCFDGHTGSTEILCDVRDAGTGHRGGARVHHDPLATGFQLVPLRPAYGATTKALLFAALPEFGSSSTNGEVQLHCISDSKRAINPLKSSVKIGELLSIDVPPNWHSCSVIQFKWYRKLSGHTSREKILMLPNMKEESSMDFGLITPVETKIFYTIGDHFTAHLRNGQEELNFMVICNSRELAKSSKVSADRRLVFPITRKMVGRCVLYVYGAANRKMDMFMFYVNDKCDATTVPSKSVIKPAQTLSIKMNGQPNGYAILRTIDEKVARLMQAAPTSMAKAWQNEFFVRSLLKEDQIRLINLIDKPMINKIISDECIKAGSTHLMMFAKCPEGKASSSSVSDHCMQQMVLGCNQSMQNTPRTGSSCDSKNIRCNGMVIQEIKQQPRLNLADVFKTPNSGQSRRIQNPIIQDDPSLEPPSLPEDEQGFTRSYFPHVWLFDDLFLGAKGSTSVTTSAPHSVGRWVIYSEYWAPGDFSFCSAQEARVTSTKDFFMEIDMPKNTYANESVTVKISVTGQRVDTETSLSICYADLPRHLCADLGPQGEKGQPAYTRVVLSPEHPVTTKTFNMRFFQTGELTLRFHLRRESYLPGEDACADGEILDSVKLSLMVSKRAETEEHYRRLILSTDKPVSKTLSDAVSELDGPASGRREIIDVFEYRSPLDASLISEVHSNLLDTDTVYSFTVDVAKFLPNTLPQTLATETTQEAVSRVKRGIVDNGNSFLTDILKKLSVQLYKFKYARLNRTPANVAGTETLENSIGSLIAEMLRFSDCTSNSTCGFSEYSRPTNSKDRSIVLTALSTSLLCEAMADEKLICGSIKYVHEKIQSMENEIDFHELIDLKTPQDRIWFLRGLLHHVSNDCMAYQCVKDDTAWAKLLRAFYLIDENENLDWRTVAALAYMGTNGTNHLMRLKMYSAVRENLLPYWSAGYQSRNVEDKLRNGYEELFNMKRVKSGDVLVNSLGILAFVGRNVDPSMRLDFDSLADWIFEQKKDDEAYENALDTYFASRALYEFRIKKVDIGAPLDNLKVEISAPNFPTKTINVTDTPIMIYLPSLSRNLTIKTTGFGKVKAGIRILASKRQRTRRELTAEDYYPVRIRVAQEKTHGDIILQTVCFTALSPVITKLEITHGIFTGYSTAVDKITVLSNSSTLGFNLFGSPMISSYAVHMLIDGLKLHKALCYEAALIPPNFSHEPTGLAPVAITARHPVNDIIGQVLVAHPDTESHRPTRSAVISHKHNHPDDKPKRRKAKHVSLRRTIRSVIDESIESVCFNGGSCTCGEMTCSVRCNSCKHTTTKTLKQDLCGANSVGIFGSLKEHKQLTVGTESSPATYHVFTLKVMNSVSRSPLKLQDQLIDVWLRSCNPTRCSKEVHPGTNYIVMGDVNDIIADNGARYNYVLRMNDVFEKSGDSCTAYLAIFFGTGFDFSKC